MIQRVENHSILGDLEKRKEITIYFNGESYNGYEGDTVASLLMANGIYSLRLHEESGEGRGVYCNIGHCYECRVKLAGKSVVRACLTPVNDGMEVHSLSTLAEGNE